MNASAPTDARQQPEEAELQRSVPLGIELSVWLHVIGFLALAFVLIGPQLLALAGADRDFDVLGVHRATGSSVWSVVGSLTLGLVMLGLAICTVWFLTSVGNAWTSRRAAARAPAVPQPTVLRRAGARGWLQPLDGPAGEELLCLAQDVGAVRFTPAGALVTVGADGTRVWDVADGRELLHLPDALSLVAISPDGERLAALRGSFGIALWSLRDGCEERVMLHRSEFWDSGWGTLSSIAFSRDGGRIVSAGDPDTRVWSVPDGEELLRIATGPLEFEALQADFGADGTWFATTSDQRGVDIWDASDGQWLQGLHDGRGLVVCSPTPELLAVVSSDGTGRVWDLTGARVVCSLPDCGQPGCSLAPAVAWTPDAGGVAGACSDGTARVWDATTGRELLSVCHGYTPLPRRRAWWLKAPPTGPTTVAISADGTMLATGGCAGVVRVWTMPASPLGSGGAGRS